MSFLVHTRKFLFTTTILASLSTAIAGVTAVASLYLTKKIRDDNLRYQELALTEDIDMSADSNDLSVYAINDGIGTSIIKELRIMYKGKCAESFGSGVFQNKKWENEYNDILQFFLEDMVASFAVANGPKWTFTKGLFEPGTLIRPGEKRLIFQIHPPLRETLSDSFARDNGSFDRINQSFGYSDKYLSISIKHCSLSEQTCSLAGWNPIGFCPASRQISNP